MIKLIIYDLDGTLIDSAKDISTSVNFMLEQLGLKRVPEEQIRVHVGSGLVHLIRNILNDAAAGATVDGILDRALDLYKTHHSEHLLDQTKLYPGVKTAVEFFRDKKQAVITNKNEEFSRQILKGLGISKYFFDVIGGDQQYPKKPAPDSVLKLMELVRVKPDETVLIGDSAIDIQTARNAKIKSIAVTYGFGSRAEIESSKPDKVVNQLDEMINLDLMKLSM